jgi:hypothetical protein
MSAKRNSAQLAFAWLQASQCPHKRLRSRIGELQWPPKIGRKLLFTNDFGIQIGVLKEIQQGLVCRQYAMADGQIAMGHELVMSEPDPWRHPDSVTEEELKSCIARVQAAHDAAPDSDLRKNAGAWADFCQTVAYIALKVALDDERKERPTLEITPTPRAN